MEITEAMLDVIEAVKGRREPQYWDNQCRRFMEKQEAQAKAVKKPKKVNIIINLSFNCYGKGKR